MRSTLPLLFITACAAAAIAQAQTAVTTPADATQRSASGPGAGHAAGAPHAAGAAQTGRHSRHARFKRLRDRSATDVTKRGAPAGKDDGILALGTTEITGNKELPKVMVIVPWKSPTDAGGVVPPTDSVMSEVLGPVDRSVFQRRIRYYGQLNAAGEQPVAPVGDSRGHRP